MAERKSITVQFTADEIGLHDDFEREASSKGETKSNYAKLIILNFENRKRIVLTADAESIKQRYEGMIVMLKEQISDIQNKFVENTQTLSLKGIDKAELSVADQVAAQMNAFKKEMAHEQLIKDNKELTKQQAEYEAEIEALEAEIKDLEDQLNTHREKLNYVEVAKQMTGPVISGLAGAFPKRASQLESFVSKGLGAFSPQPVASTASLSETEIHQLNFGKQFDETFSTEERMKVQRILDFFGHHKEAIDQNIAIISRMTKQEA